MVPAEGSEPLNFKSVYAVSSSLQAKTCIERAVMQVNKSSLSLQSEAMVFVRLELPKEGLFIDLGEVGRPHVKCPPP